MTTASGNVKRMKFARAIGWPDDACKPIKNASPMHDIGKVGIADHILMKPGKLTEDEFAKIRRHPEIGARIIFDPALVERFLPQLPEIERITRRWATMARRICERGHKVRHAGALRGPRKRGVPVVLRHLVLMVILVKLRLVRGLDQ
jgi:hypothetical protein